MPVTQANARDLASAPEKFVVGRTLRFLGYMDDQPGCFAPGDALRVLPRNACGMGIDVARVGDGRVDMVWPDEVAL